MRTNPLRVPLLLLPAFVVAAGAAVGTEGENWPAFRGADALAVAEDDPRLPESWSTTENVVWKVPIPGRGWSSPVVWGGRIFVTTVSSEGEVEELKKGLYFGGNRMKPPEGVHRWTVFSIDLGSGELMWKKDVQVGAPESPRHLKNSYASETPVTDGARVYAYFGNVGIFAFDFDGELVWEKKFEVEPTRFGWGTAASPVLHEDLLFIVNDNEGQSFFLALDKNTGEERWRVERDEGSNWVTPYVWKNELRTEVITAGTDQVRSYSLEGELLWHLSGMSSIAVPQPFSSHGLLYVSSGYIGDQNRPAFAVKPGASGDITLGEGKVSNEYIVWFQPQVGSYNPTPLVYGDHYFTLLDGGFFTVHDARTGEELYFTEQQKATKEPRRRIDRSAGAFTASPWAYNGKVFVLSEDGDTFVLDSTKGFEVVGKNSLDEVCMSTPAVADGSLILRTRTHLYHISNSAE